MTYIKKLCVFYLFARILLHLCPKENFETYLNAVIEWTSLVIVIIPLLTGKDSIANYEMWEQKLDSYLKVEEIEADLPKMMSEDEVSQICERIAKQTGDELKKDGELEDSEIKEQETKEQETEEHEIKEHETKEQETKEQETKEQETKEQKGER